MEFLNGVKRFLSRCSKKLKSKTRGVSRVSSRKACSRESKSKSPEGDPAQTPKKELPAFMHTTLKVTSQDKGKKWLGEVEKIMAATERVRGWEIDENGKVLISGYINRSQFISRLQETSENIKVEHFQGGECSSRLSRKKEAPSIKNEGPSTNNANPPTNYANPPTLGYYQPQGYGGYYGNVGVTGNGGGFYGNGCYNGNTYNYQPAVSEEDWRLL
ncbi:hypothetical protein Tco_0681463 [Tanacetum coccineum]|uniref:HMA domain-containing protein n=1 Tax=Tanacetum coccineum TaxID=301880 RepID=A0ABQ4XNQ5_9ASTR